MRLHGCLPLELAYGRVSRRNLHGRIIAATVRDDACVEENGPKSAIKLAIERLRKKDRRLTNEEKAAIAEVRRLYDSRIAEKESLHARHVSAGELSTVKACGTWLDVPAVEQDQVRERSPS
jgi:hypothetical protein